MELFAKFVPSNFEFLESDSIIAIIINEEHHFLHLLIVGLLTQNRHHFLQVITSDMTFVLASEKFKCTNKLVLRVHLVTPSAHEVDELGEINITVAISVHFVDHIL